MTTFCCYHRVDLDGQCAAAIVLRKYPQAVMVPYQYGDDLDTEPFRGNDVIMVDVSLQPFQRMRDLAVECKLTWIDHHASALEEHGKDPAPLVDGALSTGQKSGCELAWGWAFPRDPMPRAVYLLGRYDVWDLDADPDVNAFQYGLRAYNTRPEWKTWDRFFEGYGGWTDSVIKEGRIILRYVERQNKTACGAAFEANVEGLHCICLNGARGSQVFDSVWKPARHDAMCTFSTDGRAWSISLYTDKEEIDVGAIAKKNGGGGHKGAAGWQVATLPKGLIPDADTS